MENVKFSIVTPVYNGGKTISKTIESVLNQTYKPYEYHIVDAGSQDNTVAIAESYKEQFESYNIHYEITSKPDNGIYDGMNKGIKRSTGNLIGIINSDDWYEPICLMTMKDLFERTNYDMAYADIRMINGNKTFIKKASNPRFVSSKTWNHPTQFVRRELYQKKLYNNKTVFDDLDMFLWIHKNGYKIETVNKVLANFVMGGASNNRKKIKDVVDCIRIKGNIYKDNGYPWYYIVDASAIEIAKMILGK